ncbi:MAG: 50S ribosomal protein L11 methyltransferase [Clostridiales bacterium]|nr:50S ribosomal protein L11 methyltransferase [Clostridiales bacterium]
MDWTEVLIEINADDIDRASDIAQMVVPYGIYIEDYRTLEQEAMEIAHIDLIDEDLLAKDRSKGFVHIYISPEENPAEAVSFLSERYTAEGIKNTISTKLCRNEDWENNWKAYFKPIPVGKKLLIRPTWEDEYDPQGRVVMNLEPGLAFGTGTHHTTRLCLEALEDCITPDTTVLDIGCGSGILSIAALLLGAKKAVGVDIDKLAVKTAAENAAANSIGTEKFTVINGNLTDKVQGKFDVVVANIVADAIIALSSQVRPFMAEGGVFITSGIIDMREAEVTEALEKNGFRLTSRKESGGWLCFTVTAD